MNKMDIPKTNIVVNKMEFNLTDKEYIRKNNNIKIYYN
jgi:hypothetical protein